ncbi:MAG TPA: hypothetical protein VHU83_06585 [Bryobacteraceae bacterium]|jgi:hypothetical protein|nr:hypothetical protein [Bryobacteraceae bacterium]
MGACLYCTNEANSVEHPLPAAFGEFKGAPLLVDRVCKQCNNARLGVLDEQLARCGPEALMRLYYGVRGRSRHKEINPHYRRSAGGARLKMTSFDASLGLDLELEIIEGNQVRQSRQIVFREVSGSVKHLPIPEDMRNPDQLRAAFEELGVGEIAEARVFYDPEETTWIEPLVRGVWPNIKFAEGELAATSYRAGATVRIELTDRYFRAIAKIGFHYFLTQFPTYSGSEPQFGMIRGFIADGGPVSLANEFIGERQHALIGQLRDGGRPDGWKGHIVAAEINAQACLAHVQLFVCEDFPPRIFTIKLASNVDNSRSSGCGHLYAYFEKEQEGKFSGEVHSLDYGSVPFSAPPLKPVVGEPD